MDKTIMEKKLLEINSELENYKKVQAEKRSVLITEIEIGNETLSRAKMKMDSLQNWDPSKVHSKDKISDLKREISTHEEYLKNLQSSVNCARCELEDHNEQTRVQVKKFLSHLESLNDNVRLENENYQLNSQLAELQEYIKTENKKFQTQYENLKIDMSKVTKYLDPENKNSESGKSMDVLIAENELKIKKEIIDSQAGELRKVARDFELEKKNSDAFKAENDRLKSRLIEDLENQKKEYESFLEKVNSDKEFLQKELIKKKDAVETVCKENEVEVSRVRVQFECEKRKLENNNQELKDDAVKLVDTFEAEISRLSKLNLSLTNEISELKEDSLKVEYNLKKKSSSEKKELETEILELNTRLEKYKNNFEKLKADNSKLGSEKDWLQSQCDVNKYELNRLKQELLKLKSEKVDVEKKSSERKEHIAKLNSDIKVLKKEVLEKPSSFNRNLIDSLQKEIKELKTEAFPVERKNYEYKQQIAKLEGDKEELVKQSIIDNCQINSFKDDLTMFKRDNLALKDEISKLNEEFKTLSLQKCKLEAQVSSSTKKIDRLNQELVKLMGEKSSLEKGNYQNNDRLIQELVKVRSEKSSLEEENVQNKEKLVTLNNEFEKLEKEKTRLQIINDENESEFSKIREELRTVKIRKDEVVKQNFVIKCANANLNDVLKKLKRRKILVDSQITKHRAQIEKLEAEKAHLQQRNPDGCDFEKLSLQLETVKSEKIELERKDIENKYELDTLKEEINKLKCDQKYLEQKEEFDKISSACETLQRENESFETEAANYKAEIYNLGVNFETIDNYKSLLEKENYKCLSEINMLKMAFEKTYKKQRELEHELAAKLTEIAQVKNSQNEKKTAAHMNDLRIATVKLLDEFLSKKNQVSLDAGNEACEQHLEENQETDNMGSIGPNCDRAEGNSERNRILSDGELLRNFATKLERLYIADGLTTETSDSSCNNVTSTDLGNNGPNEESIQELLKTTGNSLEVTPVCRQFGGPPPGETCVTDIGNDVMLSNLPADVYEDELVPVLSSCGKIWGLRLVLDPTTGLPSGQAFVRYFSRTAAETASIMLNGYEARPGSKIEANLIVPGVRLLLGNIPIHKSVERITGLLKIYTEGLVTLHPFRGYVCPLTASFCILEYNSFLSAWNAKRKLERGDVHVFGNQIAVDWYNPYLDVEFNYPKPRVLIIYNTPPEITSDVLSFEFGSFGLVQYAQRFPAVSRVGFRYPDAARDAMETICHYPYHERMLFAELTLDDVDREAADRFLQQRSERMKNLMNRLHLVVPEGLQTVLKDTFPSSEDTESIRKRKLEDSLRDTSNDISTGMEAEDSVSDVLKMKKV